MSTRRCVCGGVSGGGGGRGGGPATPACVEVRVGLTNVAAKTVCRPPQRLREVRRGVREPVGDRHLKKRGERGQLEVLLPRGAICLDGAKTMEGAEHQPPAKKSRHCPKHSRTPPLPRA